MEVNPLELHLTAERIGSHAGDFSTAHRAAHGRAGQTALGSGVSATALPEMLEAWDVNGTRFAVRFGYHVNGLRAAANAYEQTDVGVGERIEDASSAL